MAGKAGSATFERLVVVIRLAATGALMLLCFLAICTLCSSACVGALGPFAPGALNSCFLLPWKVATMK